MLIYRIEHPESGKGPFTHTGKRGFASDAMHCIAEPIEMGYSGAGYHHFGFDSKKSMRRAIMRYSVLAEHGMQILVFSSSEQIIFEDGQVAFRRENATLLERHDITSFDF